MSVTVDSRLLDCGSPEQVEENFNRVLVVVDGKTAANQAASVEASYPTVAEFNALLGALKTAGLMVADE